MLPSGHSVEAGGIYNGLTKVWHQQMLSVVLIIFDILTILSLQKGFHDRLS